jgi:alpha-glucosidase
MPYYAGRDAGRTPMHWRNTPNGGFTEPGVTPWLPLGDTGARNVADQRGDPASILALTRDLLALRRRTPDLHSGSYTTLPAPAGAWAWRRGAHGVIVVNLADTDSTITDVDGRVLLGTNRARDGETITGPVRLRAWEAVVIET